MGIKIYTMESIATSTANEVPLVTLADHIARVKELKKVLEGTKVALNLALYKPGTVGALVCTDIDKVLAEKD